MNKIPRGQTPERKEYMKNYNATHPRRDRSAYKKEYDRVNKERIQKYLDENRDKLNALKRKRYYDNRDSLLKYFKERYKNNRDKIISYQKVYNKKNKEKIRKRERAYSKNKKEIITACVQRRRARKAAAPGSHTAQQLIERFDFLGNKCVYCGSSENITIDHDIPLSRGGSNYIENILPACRSCNSKKRTLTAKEYLSKIAA